MHGLPSNTLAVAVAVAFAFAVWGGSARGDETAGPSFDCAKAHSDDEKQICADPALARLDRGVAAAYKAALAAAGSDEAARTRLREEQRSWLGWRGRCEYDSCLDISMPRRISLLTSLAKDPGLAGKLRTVILRRGKGAIYAAYPTLDDGSPGAAAFNHAVEAAVEAPIERRARDDGFACGDNVAVCPNITVIAEPFVPAPGLLSVQISTYGIQGETFSERRAINFDLGRGRALTADDVFAGAWKKAARSYCVKEVKDKFDTPQGEAPSTDFGKLDNWRFEPGQAVVTVAYPGSFSTMLYFEAPVPDSVLAGWLKPGGPLGRK